ncbi:hypothetical protein [Terracidiphilus sp.]|uniref:hypothetical protein n=1 Tax=Terracidiphilus sp. TaxID=1964191 RepID=UPI003C267F92
MRRKRKTRLILLRFVYVAAVVLPLLIAGVIAGAANIHPLSSTVRWLFHSNSYKAELMAQPTPPNRELRHIEWDGWGGFGSDTDVYLVFDPDDSLAEPARKHLSGKFNGIPCDVPEVHRLERYWYAVLYYTNEEWNQC